jgi:hypothetical protein
MPQNMSFGSNGVDQVHSLRKNSDATLFSELVRYWHQFGQFCVDFGAVMKHSDMPQNTSLAEWSGSVAFVAKKIRRKFV